LPLRKVTVLVKGDKARQPVIGAADNQIIVARRVRAKAKRCRVLSQSW
jgi:hypothetical protein